jgi:ATP-dependent DNA helicase RecG
MASLDSPLDDIVGGRTATALERVFGITTVNDLLRHFPRRMAERGELTDLKSLRLDEDVTVLAEVLSTKLIPWGRARNGKMQRLEVTIGDGRGQLQLVFFGGRVRWQETQLQPGVRGLFSGKVGQFNHRLQLSHPEFLLLDGRPDEMDEYKADMYAGRLIPVYPASKTLRTWQISIAVDQALNALDEVPDPLPSAVIDRRKLVPLNRALRSIHQPDDREDWYRARHRLKWDEALSVQLALAQRRHAAAQFPSTAWERRPDGLLDAFDARLPFELTAGQQGVGSVIAAELAAGHPMHRLLQGEVGSGKTIVALRAMLQVVDAGGQAALLAPTEVLAAQHARTLDKLLGPLARAGQLDGADTATRVALLTGSMATAPRRAALLQAASGEAGIVVGTHALIQEHVQFANLGLVVVDEQHRFGVEQRDALRTKAVVPPHLLVMTATPIPRTVAMTVFGDLETSTLSELPAGRSPIATSVVPVAERPGWLTRAWDRIREEVAAGRQAYVVCPRIGDEDMGEFEAEFVDEEAESGARRPTAAVTVVAPLLRDGPLAGLRIEMLHGRLTPEEKDRVMTEFAAGRIDVLVATTVIEVGVDVPNATVMAIIDADRFGVSQLHQLRGRVGRGGHAGLCLLITEAPEAAASRERLDAVAATSDGFELARLDVEQRSEGDVLGSAQSGRRRHLKLLSLLHDEQLIAEARDEATIIVTADPQLELHPNLAALVSDLVADDQADFLEKG